MNNTNNHDERIAKMTFASVYPHYLTKVEKKDRTKEELHQVIEWLTGYSKKKLQELIEEKVTFEKFLQSSKQGEFHPLLLTEPYVNLSIHTALQDASTN